MTTAALVAAGCLLLAGLLLRATLPPLRALFIPASVVGGFVGLAVVQSVTHGVDASAAVAGHTEAIAATLRGWPGPLLAVVFAAMLLHAPSDRPHDKKARRVIRQGLMVWLIVLGQVVVGLLAVVLLIRPLGYEVPGAFGQLIEATFAGGHGTGGAMGTVLVEALDFAPGLDLAMLMATAALVGGVVLGIGLVNLGLRRGWCGSSAKLETVSGLEPRRDPKPAMLGRSRSDVIDPLVLQAALVALAFGIGWAMQAGFTTGVGTMVEAFVEPGEPDVLGRDRVERIMKFAGNLPLFLFTLLGGLILRKLLIALRLGDLIDTLSLQRITGLCIDLLIVAAITTLRIETVVAFLVPGAILLGLGLAWAVFCLLFLAPRLLPRGHWFELGLINFGMSTGTTAQGMMLLRMVDPELETDAAEDYALAAPLSAPFVGGGVVTFTLPLLMATPEPGVPVVAVALGLAVVWAGLLLAAWRLRRVP
ncbi:MAG: sodium/glutamate symporter [Planctomycetota bacterium]